MIIRKISIPFIIMVIMGLFFSAGIFKSAQGAGKIHFVLIFPGGPDTGAQGRKIINQFMQSLARQTGLSPSRLSGKYFNDMLKAKSYIRQNKNTFIMGSLGFFLTNRKSMKFIPLTTVKLKGNNKEQFYMLIKKNAYKSLKELKGKILAGNILYEDKKFINRIIFNNYINASVYFKLKPTRRPLSAVRRVVRGKYDAVLLNHMQYQSLKKLSLFKKLQIVHKSSKFPALGLMMVDTKNNRSIQGKIVKAITSMCSLKEGVSVCKNFGIDGFEKINPGELDYAIKKYEGAR